MSKTNNIEREFVEHFIPHQLNVAEKTSDKNEKYVMRGGLIEF